MSERRTIRVMNRNGEVRVAKPKDVWRSIMESVKPREQWDEEDEKTLRELSGEDE